MDSHDEQRQHGKKTNYEQIGRICGRIITWEYCVSTECIYRILKVRMLASAGQKKDTLKLNGGGWEP